jgi:lysophospholipid acyltransferase
VNFYAVITTFATLAFFASPAKVHLRNMLEKRSHVAGGRLSRTTSTDNIKEPILGLSADPGVDINEAIQELQAEVGKAKLERARKASRKKEL